MGIDLLVSSDQGGRGFEAFGGGFGGHFEEVAEHEIGCWRWLADRIISCSIRLAFMQGKYLGHGSPCGVRYTRPWLDWAPFIDLWTQSEPISKASSRYVYSLF